MRAFAIRAVLLFPGLLGVAACASLTEPGDGCGTFEGRLSGAASDTVSGCALFSMDTTGTLFGMLLTNGGPYDVYPAIKLVGPRRPVTGTTPIFGCSGGGSELCGVAFLGSQRFALSGTIVVTESDTLNLKGSITATGTDPDGTVLSISGSFMAPCRGHRDPFETLDDPPGNARKPTPCKPGTGTG
ncbi:MAG: hypothetical protein ACRENU_13320 [Gemmatimonadaceae bacterium]